MKKTIWKYEISPDNLVIQMPKYAEILSVQTQNGNPCVWAMVDPEEKLQEVVFEMYGTGQEIPCDCISREFIGTFQLYSGNLVFHLFVRN